MISVQEHLSRILAGVQPIPPQAVDVRESLGCVLAQDVLAVLPLPGFDNSAMDGYAVRAEDLVGASPTSPVRLPVDGDIPAGVTTRPVLTPGRTLRIMTGAPMPEGSDAVVAVERTDGGTETVALMEAPAPGQHVRRLGGDVNRDDRILPAGAPIGPAALALLAAAGVTSVSVVPRPRVAVLSTGDELVTLGQTPAFGQLVDSNSLMLEAAVGAAGGVAVLVQRSVDEADAFVGLLERALLGADIVITSGGVSMGAYDTVKEVLSASGDVQFSKVAMRPGMPQGFGVLGPDKVPIITLPGNPVSSMVSFQVFVVPALRRLAGLRHATPPSIGAVAGEDWSGVLGKTEFSRVLVTEGVARLAGGQGSHMLGSMAAASHLAMIPPETSHVAAGDVVRCLPILGTPT